MDSIHNLPLLTSELAQSREFFFNVAPSSVGTAYFDLIWPFIDNVYSIVSTKRTDGQTIQYVDCR